MQTRRAYQYTTVNFIGCEKTSFNNYLAINYNFRHELGAFCQM